MRDVEKHLSFSEHKEYIARKVMSDLLYQPLCMYISAHSNLWRDITMKQ
jgi:hypothetical protein